MRDTPVVIIESLENGFVVHLRVVRRGMVRTVQQRTRWHGRLRQLRFVEPDDPLVRHLIVVLSIWIEVLLARHSGHGKGTAEQCNEAAGQHGGCNERARRLLTGVLCNASLK